MTNSKTVGRKGNAMRLGRLCNTPCVLPHRERHRVRIMVKAIIFWKYIERGKRLDTVLS